MSQTRSGSYIMRSGSFEARIEANEGNMIFGHSGSVRWIDASSGSRAHLTSSLSGSVMSTELVLGVRETSKPFWVFKPDGRIQYSKGGEDKVSEISLDDKFLYSTRSAHDSADKFDNYEISERDKAEEKGKVKGGENTFDKQLIVSGTNPIVSLFKTDAGSLTQVTHNRYFYVSGTYPWSIFQTVSGDESYYGGNASVGTSAIPSLFWFSASGDFYTSGIVSSSGIHYMPTASIGGGIFTSASLAAGGGGGGVSSYDDLTDVPSGIFSSSLQTFTNITASGNISSSGDLNIQNIYLDDNYSIYNKSETVRLRFKSDELKVVSGPFHASNITASGNISASEGFILGYPNNNESTFFSASLEKVVIRNNNSSAAVPRLEFKTTNLVSKIDSLRQNAGTNLDLVFQTEGGGNQRVGIKTASPTKTLTVDGDVSASGEYYGKWKCTSTHAFYATNNSVNFIPMAASLNESSFADSYYHRNIAPYDGRLVRVMLVCQNNDPGNVSVGLTTGSGAMGLTKDNGEICTVASCVDDTSYTFDFTGSDATFNKGEDVGIQFQQANSVANGTYITAVWEYDSGGT